VCSNVRHAKNECKQTTLILTLYAQLDNIVCYVLFLLNYAMLYTELCNVYV